MKKIRYLFIFLALFFSGCTDQNKSGGSSTTNYQNFEDNAVNVVYKSNFPNYVILDYENEEADISLSICKIINSSKNHVETYTFSENEHFKMYYENVTATFPRTFYALYIFLD